MSRVARFKNPHGLLQNLQKVSRKELNTENGGEDLTLDTKISKTLQRELDQIIASKTDFSLSVGAGKYGESTLHFIEPMDVDEQALHSFRLFSSVKEPQLVSLELNTALYGPLESVPKVVPAEDTEEEAQLRRLRALAIAVDADSLKNSCLRQSKKSSRKRKDRKLLHATFLQSSKSIPMRSNLMVLEAVKPKRSTRPPVPSTELAFHPYKAGVLNPDEVPSKHTASFNVLSISW